MKKSLLHVMVANIFYMIVVAGTNFILPKFTTVDVYAGIKEYTLYITTYVDIITLGYTYGMYLKCGGKKIETITPDEVGRNIFTFFVFMASISSLTSVVGMVLQKPIIIILGVGFLASNVLTYFQMLYQATGEFKEYGVALSISQTIVLLEYIVLIFVFKVSNRFIYIVVTPITGLMVSGYLAYKLNKRIHFIPKMRFSFKELVGNIKGGIVLMLGEFVTQLFTNIDRWFVKIFMATLNFAIYSFAVSLENIVKTLMRPIAVSMYNYFCKESDSERVKKIKEATLIYSFIIIALAFPIKWIIECFIQEYIEAVTVIFPLFAAQGISTIIKGIYVNIYKADGKQKKYLTQMSTMLATATVLNAILFFAFRSATAIAIATLITNIVWLIICEVENPNIRYCFKANCSAIIMLIIYMCVGLNLNAIIGCVIYCTVGILIGYILMRESFFYVIKGVIDMLFKKKRKKNV